MILEKFVCLFLDNFVCSQRTLSASRRLYDTGELYLLLETNLSGEQTNFSKST